MDYNFSINANTVLLIIILLGIAYIIYQKDQAKDQEQKQEQKQDQRKNRRRIHRNDRYILANSNAVYPYYGYGYRRWYW